MAKPNYQYEKRQRDLAKKNKKEEKRRQKLASKTPAGDTGLDGSDQAESGTSESGDEAEAIPQGATRSEA